MGLGVLVWNFSVCVCVCSGWVAGRRPTLYLGKEERQAKRPTPATHPSDPPPATHLWDIYIRLRDRNSNMVSFCVFTFLRLKVFSTFTLHKKNRRKVLGVQGSRAHQDASFEHHASSVGPSNVWVFSFLRKEAFQYFWCLPIIFWSYSRIF